MTPDLAPATLLVNLWLSMVGGHEDAPASFELAMPGEGVLCKELPPDPSIEALGSALSQHAEEGRLLCYAYDWRQDLTASATRLAAELVEQCELLGVPQVDIVAIGPGALVTRYLVESGALGHAAERVRRVVLLGSPNWGVPAGLLLLHGLLNVIGPEVVLRDVLAKFPAALQLIPPRGVSYLYLEGSPGVRIEPFAWPEVFFGAGESGQAVAKEVTEEVMACNEALHSHLMESFDSSWRRTLVFVSGSEPTFSDLHVDMNDGKVEWSSAARRVASGDGVTPLLSTMPRPSTRCFAIAAPHLELASNESLQARLRAFLTGPMS